MGGQGGCERRTKIFVKIQKKMGLGGRGRGWVWGRGSGWGCLGGCKRRIEVFGKIHKKKSGGGLGGGSGGVGWWGQGGYERNVGVGGNGVCEPRIEGIVQ